MQQMVRLDVVGGKTLLIIVGEAEKAEWLASRCEGPHLGTGESRYRWGDRRYTFRRLPSRAEVGHGVG